MFIPPLFAKLFLDNSAYIESWECSKSLVFIAMVNHNPPPSSIPLFGPPDTLSPLDQELQLMINPPFGEITAIPGFSKYITPAGQLNLSHMVDGAYIESDSKGFTLNMLQTYAPFGPIEYRIGTSGLFAVVDTEETVETIFYPSFPMAQNMTPLFLPRLATFRALSRFVISIASNGERVLCSSIWKEEEDGIAFYLIQGLDNRTITAEIKYSRHVDGLVFDTITLLHGTINWSDMRFGFNDDPELFFTEILSDWQMGGKPSDSAFELEGKWPIMADDSDADDDAVWLPQSGVTPPRKTLCRLAGGSVSPPSPNTSHPIIPYSPELTDGERDKARSKANARRRDAKSRKNNNVFRPQGLTNFFSTRISVDEELKSTLDRVSDNAGEFTKHLPEIQGLLSRFADNGMNVTVGIDKNVLHVPAIIGLFSLGYMSVTEGGKWHAALAAASTAYVTTCAVVHREWLMKRLSKIISKDRETVLPQAMDSSIIEELAGAICGYLALVSSKAHIATSGKIMSLVKSFSTFDRSKLGLTSAIQFSIRLLEKIVNWFRDSVLGLPRISLLESSIPELQSWTDKIDMVVEESYKGTLVINTANAARLHSLLMEGNQLSAKKFGASDAAQVRMALSTYMSTLRKLTLPFDQANFAGNSARMEPVVILLSGKPGVGKTWMLLPLIMEVLKEVLPSERRYALNADLNNEIFSRYPETKYWEGYRGQEACIFDDFGQARDAVGQPDNEYLELIRAANIFPYQLHMAGIEAKGCTNFTSRLIFCTTNVENFRPDSIIEPEAVMRRFDMILSVYPKAEFCVDPTVDRAARRLDKSKAGDRFKEDIHEFCLKKASGTSIGTDIVEILSFSELKSRIVSLYKKRALVADVYVADLSMRNKLEKFAPEGLGQSSLIQMEELREFDDAFDSSVPGEDLSDKTLEELLAEPAVDPLDANVSLFVDTLRGMKTLDYDSLLDELQSAGFGHEAHSRVYGAYRRNPAAFLACAEKKPELLAKLIRRLQPEPCVVIDSDDRNKLQKAKSTLSLYWVKAAEVVSSLKSRWSWLEEWQKALIIASVFSAGLCAFGVAAWSKRENPEQGEPEKVISADELVDMEDPRAESGGPRDKNPKFKISKLKTSNVFKPEGGLDLTADAMMAKAVCKSTYLMTIPVLNDQRLGYGTFIKGKLLFMPYHFLSLLKDIIVDQAEDTDVVKFENVATDSVRRITIRDILQGHLPDPALVKKDLCIVYLDVHQHPDISKFFVTDKQMENFSRMPASLYTVRTDPKCVWVNHAVVRRDGPQTVYGEECGMSTYVVQDVLKYDIPTVPGDCGALLIAQLTGFGPGKFLGFHVAGSTNRIGFATVLTHEDIEKAVERTAQLAPGPVFAPPFEEDLFLPQCARMPVPGHFVPYKTIDKAVSQPGRSKITYSLLHNEWTTSPYGLPRLRPFETPEGMKDPLLMAVERYGQEPAVVKREPLSLAGDYIASRVLSVVNQSSSTDPRILSFEEAVLGLPEEKYCKSIPRGTSAGYPYILKEKPGHRGKERFFGKLQDFDLSGEECVQLKKECESMVDSAREGKRSEVVYVDFLKDETRKHKRVAEGNTRLISAAPIVYSIVCRMFFMSFVMAVMAYNLFVGIGVGINCYSEDWDVLAKLLRSKGDNIIAGDFTGFDTSHYQFLAEQVLKIIQAYYAGRCEPKVRDVLFADLTDSVHILRDLIYQWCAGRLPSGHPLTAVFSSFMDEVLYVAAWIVLNPKGAAGVGDFAKHVCLVTYGDDSICSVSDHAIKFFNFHSISKCMADFGYTYTDEMKLSNEEAPPCRSLSEVTFLKRGFRFETRVGRWVAPLKLDAILEMLYWTKRGASSKEITCTNVVNALRELSLHEKSVFDEWAPKIISASRERLDFHPEITDYRTLQQIACGLEVFW